MGEVVEITDAGQIGDLAETEDVVVVKFTAPSWCGPCVALAPHYEAAAEGYSSVVFAEVNLDNYPDIALDFGVKGVPQMFLYVGGEFIHSIQARTALAIIGEIKEFTTKYGK